MVQGSGGGKFKYRVRFQVMVWCRAQGGESLNKE